MVRRATARNAVEEPEVEAGGTVARLAVAAGYDVVLSNSSYCAYREVPVQSLRGKVVMDTYRERHRQDGEAGRGSTSPSATNRSWSLDAPGLLDRIERASTSGSAPPSRARRVPNPCILMHPASPLVRRS